MSCALSRLTRWSGRPLKKQNSKGVKKDENMDQKKIICCQQPQNLPVGKASYISSTKLWRLILLIILYANIPLVAFQTNHVLFSTKLTRQLNIFNSLNNNINLLINRLLRTDLNFKKLYI